MPTIYKDVVGQPVLFEDGETAAKLGAQQKAIVRLALRDVTHPDELRVSAEPGELCPDVRRPKIDPSDDAGDEGVRIGQRQQPMRFFERLPRLDRDARV